MHMASVFERASEFDVIHSHAYHYALPFSRFAQSAVLHTHHILPNPDVVRAYARYPEAHVAAISDYQRQSFWPVQTVAVVHHGLNTEWFPFGARRGDYLAFLGRMLPDKGPLEAIGIAREVGMRLVLAGPDEDDYFRDAVAPQVDNRWVEYIGPVDRRSRGELLSKAAALVYPITEPEPFGLVMVEAMLCGTPVAAMRLGAVAEIVDEGITGLTAESVPELAARIDATLALDRHRVRSTALERFNHVRMTGDYLNVYRQLIGSRVAIHDRAASTGHLRAS
jgi:glycosyltransferase involved in cell wall biosynthesis